ncbi:MAG: ImmA/IrrE family metallo-endopeptidase [Clostridium saudiense]|uniref:ImmA/IrrE family metallo-endopeptidase n=1 Tax=Clostridium saudiense TaxID=1414720 RepID=UPI003995D80F
MYNPSFRMKSNNVPVLSKEEIDNIAEKFLMDFNLETLVTPQPIDEDRFLTEYLGLEQDFQYLSHCGCYLGMLVFNDTNKVQVYDIYTGRAEYISTKAGTVIIDNTLLEEGQEQRYRFTAIHEAGHWIFHRKKYYRDMSQRSLFNFLDMPNIQCRTVSVNPKFKPIHKWDDNDTMEWQANYFSSAVLMLKSMVFKICNDEDYIEHLRLMSWGDMKRYNELLIRRISNTFNVSKQAAEVRLNNLKLINSYDDNKYTPTAKFNNAI